MAWSMFLPSTATSVGLVYVQVALAVLQLTNQEVEQPKQALLRVRRQVRLRVQLQVLWLEQQGLINIAILVEIHHPDCWIPHHWRLS